MIGPLTGGYPMLFHVQFDTYHLIIVCLKSMLLWMTKVLVYFNPYWRYQRNGRTCSSLMDDDHPWMAHRCWNLHVCWKLALIRGDYWNPIRCRNPLPSSHPASPACPACLASFALHRFNSSTVTGCFTPGLHILGLPRFDISTDPRKITWVPRTEVTSRCRWQKDSHCINKCIYIYMYITYHLITHYSLFQTGNHGFSTSMLDPRVAGWQWIPLTAGKKLGHPTEEPRTSRWPKMVILRASLHLKWGYLNYIMLSIFMYVYKYNIILYIYIFIYLYIFIYIILYLYI